MISKATRRNLMDVDQALFHAGVTLQTIDALVSEQIMVRKSDVERLRSELNMAQQKLTDIIREGR